MTEEATRYARVQSILGDALDRALASIAERVYPDGPTRIRRAFLDAEVETVYTPPVWERLDREPSEDIQPRFIVRSGSFGRGSRVEFVCPGRRIDPRGPQGESVMNKMCPDKYASEASAVDGDGVRAHLVHEATVVGDQDHLAAPVASRQAVNHCVVEFLPIERGKELMRNIPFVFLLLGAIPFFAGIDRGRAAVDVDVL